LHSTEKEDGFRYLFDRDLARFSAIQRSWLQSGDTVVRYEDLITNGKTAFEHLFCDRLDLPVSPRQVGLAVEACSFEKLHGRKLGQVDEKAHARQGLPGDWKNHFTPALRKDFAQRTGDLLTTAGYEKDDAWLAPDSRAS
jgi:lipopolysaccharide transport system ATP-binding protein